MAFVNREQVSATYHYIVNLDDTDEDAEERPYSAQEFAGLVDFLTVFSKKDTEEQGFFEDLKLGRCVKIDSVNEINRKTIFGVFQKAYSGHSFDNTEKGKISRDSLNLRKFSYLLYLSDDGQIYLGCQYLGMYGGYDPLKQTMFKYLRQLGRPDARTFRLQSNEISDMKPKEIRLQLSAKSAVITDRNPFNRGSVYVISGKASDHTFKEDVMHFIQLLMGKEKAFVKKELARLANEGQLSDIRDEDIEDVSILASVGGRNRTIHLLEGQSFASRFHLKVGLDKDGLPVREQTKEKMLDILKEEIISRKADV